jgi:DNA-binding NtrC family response regulator
MSEFHVLLVEDDSDWLGLYQEYLAGESYRLETADSVEQAFRAISETSYDVVVTDLKMLGFGEEFGGFSVIRKVKEVDKTTQVVVITAYGTRDIALIAQKQGAFDLVSKPPEPENFRIIIRNALKARLQLASHRVVALPASVISVPAQPLKNKPDGLFGVLGTSVLIQAALRDMSYAIHTDLPVLVYGEKGTGKTLVARTIHSNSPNRKKFSVMSLADFLSNHEILRATLYRLRDATFILEELFALQPAEREIVSQMLNAMKSENIRVISTLTTDATSLENISKNWLGEPLFSQLAGLKIYLPPLRDRKDGDDIPTLAEHAIHEAVIASSSKGEISFSAESVNKLISYSYRKGNVQELFDIIKKAIDFIGGSGQVIPEHLMLNPSESAEERSALSKATGRVFALLIGIDRYQNLRNLRKAARDARDLRDMLAGTDIFRLEVLLDEAATKEAILNHLDAISAQASAQDKVIIFYSGHGAQLVSTTRSEYLCPVNSDLKNPDATLISSDELTASLRKIAAAQLLMIMDACHAGGIGEPKGTDPSFRSGLSEKSYELLSSGQGRVIIASSKPDEVSWELEEHQNGLFTHYLLEGLRGQAARADGSIWLTNLFGYIAEKIPQHKPQHPYLKSQTEDFVVIQVKNLVSRPAAENPKDDEKWKTHHVSLIRELLVKVFNDETLTVFCHDYYYPVYDNFSTGMSKNVKIDRLIDHCQRGLEIEDLLVRIREKSPRQFAIYAEKIKL